MTFSNFFLRLDLEVSKVRHWTVQVWRRCSVVETWGIDTPSDLLNFVVKELQKIFGSGWSLVAVGKGFPAV